MPKFKDKGYDNPEYIKTNIETMPKNMLKIFKSAQIVEKRLRISQNDMRMEKTSRNKPFPTENLKKNHTAEVCLCLGEI